MITPPTWFLRELNILDPRYYVLPNGEHQDYEIRIKKNINGHAESRIVGIFKRLNDHALNDMRYRKYLGRKFNTGHDESKWLKHIQVAGAKEREKEKDNAREMMAEGFMRIYMLDKRKYFT